MELSFRYGRTAVGSGSMPWPGRVRALRGARGVKARRAAWTDPERGLRVWADERTFRGFPAVEQTVFFENRGKRPSRLMSEIYPLDVTLASVARGCPVFDTHAEGTTSYASFVLHYAMGSSAGPEDYRPLEQPLGVRGVASFELSAAGGRSSNRHLPFLNVQTGPRSGVIVAVGWSGQWHARFDMQPDGRLRVRAGMERTHLKLKPGERIRTPRIVWFPWKGDRREAHNAWRRFLVKHVLPTLDGKTPPPATWGNTWFTFDCGYGVNEENQAQSMAGAGKLGLEYLTIDAGWYECANPYWWDGVGSWVPRADTFPNGFGPVSAAGEKAGVGLGLWFEPERAAGTSRVGRKHPGWLLGECKRHWTMAASVGVKHRSYCVDLGQREVQDWLIRLIDKYVAQGMRWFRHDFNLDPLDVWREADAPDRQGMSEIRYVEGLYRVLDEIHRRHPDLFMEGCASGGRRIDIETISRNHGYWATDMMCGTPGPMQSHIRGFNDWLLPNWHNTVLRMQNAPKEDTPANRYAFFSFLGGAPCLCFDLRDERLNHPLGRKWIRIFKQVRRLTMGDFYPLTEWSLSREVWMAYQFHRADMDAGLVVAFRRPGCPYDRAEFALRGLAGGCRYRFRSLLERGNRTVTGEVRGTPFPVELAHRPDVALWAYRAQR